MKKWPAIAAASVIVVGTLAFAGYRIYLNEAHDKAVMLVPANALVYANAFLNPSTHQKQALRDLLEKFPAAGDPKEARGTLERYLDDALAGTGVDFSHDVEPWLGREIAVAMIPPLPPDDLGAEPNVVGYVGTNDGEKAMSFIERLNEGQGTDSEGASYEGIDYEVFEDGAGVAGIIGDFLVLATNEESFKKSVDASAGKSLGTNDEYKEAIDPLPDDRVMLSYASFSGFFNALKVNGDVPPELEETLPQLRDLEPVAAAATLRSDGVIIELVSKSELPDSDSDGDVIASVPRASWGAIGVHDLGTAVTRRLKLLSGRFGVLGSAAIKAQIKSFTGLDLEDDILSWMGDAAAFVEGTRTPPRGGVFVHSNDGRKSASAVAVLGRTLNAQGLPVGVGDSDSTHARVAFTDPSLPTLIQLVAIPDAVWLVFGADTADEIGSATLDASPVYKDAKAAMGDFSMIGFLDVDGARSFGEKTFIEEDGPLPAEYTATVAPNLDPVSFVALGSRTLDGVTSYRLMIGVE